jgi:hypothetical protein
MFSMNSDLRLISDQIKLSNKSCDLNSKFAIDLKSDRMKYSTMKYYFFLTHHWPFAPMLAFFLLKTPKDVLDSKPAVCANQDSN